jgi:hypothetical protein
LSHLSFGWKARRVGNPPLERHEVRLRGLRLGISARCGVLVLAAALLGAAPAAAQFRIDLDPGAQVRLATAAAPERFVRGRVLRMDGGGTTIVVWPRSAAPGVEAAYPLSELATLEVRGGRDRARGALIGVAIATAGSALFGGIDRVRGELSSGELAGTVAGNAVAGALLGYAFAPRGWRRLPLPRRA